VGVFFGGLSIAKDEEALKTNCPHIVVGTPGRILALIRSKKLVLKNLKHFILDECDKMLEQLGKCFKFLLLIISTPQGLSTSQDLNIINGYFFTDMRRDVQEIYRSTPHEKQVMMFSATLSKDIRPVCKKFMQDVREISVFDQPLLSNLITLWAASFENYLAS